MEIPTMVERAGNKLVVRSLFGGEAIFQTPYENGSQRVNAALRASSSMQRQRSSMMSAEVLEKQLEAYRQQSNGLNRQQSNGAAASSAQTTAARTIATEPVEGAELPQCKIRRNYSCNHCSFFTQNPRCHLSHLRDVHGEKIVINECKLCLYASRHFQKLVRHMKMVHGCSDDGGQDAGNGSLQRAKRFNVREARKRRLEESIESTNVVQMKPNGPPTLEQLKLELQLQEQQLVTHMQSYSRQQELHQLQQIVNNNQNIFSMAYEFQAHLQSRAAQPPMQLPPAPPLVPIRQSEGSAKPSEAEFTNSEAEETLNNSSPSPPTADENLDSSANPVGLLKCEKCSYSTTIKARFKKHVKYHSMPLIKCSSCDFHTPYKWNLDRHTKNHGANGNFRCDSCDFSTDIKQSLTIHELNHHSGSVREQLSHDKENGEGALYKSTNAKMRKSLNEPVGSSMSSMVLSKYQPQGKRTLATSQANSSETNTELAPISCSYCHQIMPNAIVLVKHLQHCVPAMQHKNKHFQSACAEPKLEGQTNGMQTPSSRSSGSNAGNYSMDSGYAKTADQILPTDLGILDSMRRVFKCPNCTFWATTASRFHVHIVGHLNRKPFECSFCSYRSNWSWDITKHIRMKGKRDKLHCHAEVLMNDDTGKRNYSKYNQYLTYMKINVDASGQLDSKRGSGTGVAGFQASVDLSDESGHVTDMELFVFNLRFVQSIFFILVCSNEASEAMDLRTVSKAVRNIPLNEQFNLNKNFDYINSATKVRAAAEAAKASDYRVNPSSSNAKNPNLIGVNKTNYPGVDKYRCYICNLGSQKKPIQVGVPIYICQYHKNLQNNVHNNNNNINNPSKNSK